MTNTILIKRSATANSVPASGNLQAGELAINYTDGNLFYKDASGNVNVIASNKFVSVSGNITGGNIITVGSVSASGNVTGNYFIGNGSQLTGIAGGGSGASISNGTSNVNVVSLDGNVTVGVGGSSNVAVFATSGEYINGLLSVSGTVTAGNLSTGGTSTAASYSTAGNITGGNVLFGSGIVSGTGNITATNLTGTLQTAAQTNITSVGTLSSLSVSGTATVGNVSTIGTVSATGNITGGNILGGANVNATTHTGTTVSVTGAITGAAITGSSLTVSTGNITAGNLILSGAIVDSAQLDIQTSAGNANIVLTPNGTGNVNTGANLSVTGNITAGNVNATLNGSGANVSSISATNISSGTLAQARLANAAVTLGSTSLTLGSTVTTVAGLTSVTSTTFVGALTGAATSATTAGTVTTAAQGNITSVGTLSSLSVTGTITSSNIVTGLGTGNDFGTGAFQALGNGATNTIFPTVGFHQPAAYASSIQLRGAADFRFYAQGAASFANVTANIFTGTATNARYADLAEKYRSDADYEPGTVVEFGGDSEVTVSTQDSSRRIAGVVSTNPAHLMNSILESEFTIDLALAGRVPVKVQGAVRKGDMLVSAGNGRARAEADPKLGSVIGKALENFTDGEGTIEVLVLML
jgi:hypothetical protein